MKWDELYKRVHQIEEEIDSALLPYRLSDVRVKILTQLKDGPRYAAELARVVGIKTQSLAGLLNRMERDGQVRRERRGDEQDHRLTWVYPEVVPELEQAMKVRKGILARHPYLFEG